MLPGICLPFLFSGFVGMRLVSRGYGGRGDRCGGYLAAMARASANVIRGNEVNSCPVPQNGTGRYKGKISVPTVAIRSEPTQSIEWRYVLFCGVHFAQSLR
jgi:hypothetical protein